MKAVHNCVIAGIGGQGAHTLAAIIEDAAVCDGYDVKGSELHGLAMRFGPLECHVRFGKRVYSPLVARGEADLIIALEPLEALRVAHFANSKTSILLDTKAIIPISTYMEKKNYPKLESILSDLEKFTKNVIVVNASEKVQSELGHTIYANTYLLGIALSKKLLPLKKENILAAIAANVSAAVLEKNKRAFEMGLEY